MSGNLPVLMAEFVTAKNRHDGAAITACFAEDATVYDEGERIQGHTEIRKWIDAANVKYKVSYDFLDYSEDGENALLTLMVSGEFEGSPLPLDYQLKVNSGKITELRIVLSEK
ncbi:nuclear transport factor 2 family protein [Geovibrio thiophilus]|uniref:Nuclear transport factor 2 family protein n=1 Tax=Geovibrio thiophilus TaxID=139438 RepID=A0A410K0D2_9BACT|nr:nuclear transport factor 2 family protein [Geovibrio thiophilus]QAR33862.1 nuclear transport factor 2 family protein [Geovibrio thiophilus]